MSTCACGKTTRDDAYLCDDDRRELTALLAELPWIDAQLEVSLTRQKGASTEGSGSRGTETPLPWHDKASMARRTLQGILAAWVGAEGSITALSTRVDVERLAFHPSSYDVLEALDNAAEDARSVIFYKPPASVYLGVCESRECRCACHGGSGYACSDPTTCQNPEAESRTEQCPGDVYAPEGADVGSCQVCRRKFSGAVKRRALEDELDDKLYTASEIAHLSTFLGLDLKRDSVRKLVNQWHKRKRITAAAWTEAGQKGDPKFRYGDVKPLLYAAKARREGAV
jgi:hypothetical protein